MKPLYRRIFIFVAALALIVGGYMGYRFFNAWQRGNVPQEFSEARSQGGLVAEKIVANSNDVVNAIASLNSPTSTRSQVSSTLGQVLLKTTEIRKQAIELSATLETMTRALPKVRSSEAQQAALQSISQRLALVGRLITYTDEVNQLAAVLRLRLESGASNTKEITRLINEINTEVTAVNNFNRAANESMEKFDALLR